MRAAYRSLPSVCRSLPVILWHSAALPQGQKGHQPPLYYPAVPVPCTVNIFRPWLYAILTDQSTRLKLEFSPVLSFCRYPGIKRKPEGCRRERKFTAGKPTVLTNLQHYEVDKYVYLCYHLSLRGSRTIKKKVKSKLCLLYGNPPE